MVSNSLVFENVLQNWRKVDAKLITWEMNKNILKIDRVQEFFVFCTKLEFHFLRKQGLNKEEAKLDTLTDRSLEIIIF